MEPDDDALVAQALGGRDEAFRVLFERHHRTVYRFVYAMTADHTRAEDMVQETFVAAHRGLASRRGEGRLTTWLCAIARNLLAKSMRGRRVQISETPAPLQLVDPAHTPEERVIAGELSEAISRAVLQLDEEKRTAFVLKMIEGLSYEEASAITGSAVAKLKTDVFRAKSRMRELLAGFIA